MKKSSYMMSIFDLLFTFDGRVSRRTFWLWNATYFLLIISVATAVKNFSPETASMVLPTTLVLLVFPDLVITAKRWHDRNKSRVWLVLYIPLILTRLIIPTNTTTTLYQPTTIESWLSIAAMLCGAWIFIECGLFEGDEKENQYGPVPTR